MQPTTLVVSDPPHQEVDLDAAAALVGLDLYETRLKFIFPAPEVLAPSDREDATEVAESYEDAGVSVAIIDGQALRAVPWPNPVSWFRFTGTGLTTRLQEREIEIPYDSEVMGVYCKPPSDFKADKTENAPRAVRDGLAIIDEIEWMPNLDLYFAREGATQRLSIVQGLTDFSGLGPMRQRTAAEDMAATVTGCSRRFPRMRIDTRLENVRPRRRFVGGDSAFNPDLRKRYAFGTLLLQDILASIGPELRELTQYELGSRLGYLTSRCRACAPPP